MGVSVGADGQAAQLSSSCRCADPHPTAKVRSLRVVVAAFERLLAPQLPIGRPPWMDWGCVLLSVPFGLSLQMALLSPAVGR